MVFTLVHCNPKTYNSSKYKYQIIGASNRTVEHGDPKAGYDYLLYGDYIGAGLPFEQFGKMMGQGIPLLEREGSSKNIIHSMNVFETDSNKEVIAGLNCLACHASEFEGQLVVGLGNSNIDISGYTSVSAASKMLSKMIQMKYGDQSPEWESAHQFIRGFDAVSQKIKTPFHGANPAFRIEETAAAHRNPKDLTWNENRVFEYSEEVIASDTPPWWHVGKKNALYYNGMGRGAFSKMMEQISVVAIRDSTQARSIHNNFTDVLAYIESIEPPKFTRDIDNKLAREGQLLFVENCKTCHGSYEGVEKYPNKLIPLEEVKTDPYYARTLAESNITSWYNESWYSQSYPPSIMEPTLSYIAPPLDGIWITAPYLHNGSVPNLYSLLKSNKRPKRWKKVNESYDYERVGWKYTESTADVSDRNVYDTSIEGYGNSGHRYGDKLSENERFALIEYLKTL